MKKNKIEEEIDLIFDTHKKFAISAFKMRLIEELEKYDPQNAGFNVAETGTYTAGLQKAIEIIKNFE